MSLRSDAIDLADRVTTSALHELRMAVNERIKDYRERACWRASFHTVMVRELTAELVEVQRHGKAGIILTARVDWHDGRRIRALAECEANDIEKQLMSLCFSKMNQ